MVPSIQVMLKKIRAGAAPLLLGLFFEKANSGHRRAVGT
jgi:hypothetical protein